MEWRQFAGATIFCLFGATVGVAIEGVYLPIQFLLGEWACGFMWGYFYRQWLLDEGLLPLSSLRRFRVLEYLGIGMPETHEIDRLERFRLRHRCKITMISSWFLVVCGIVSILTIKMLTLQIASIALVSTVFSSFASGYVYRQHIVDQGRCPKWRFLRLVGDCADS